MLPPTWRPQVRQISGQNSEISGNDTRALASSTTRPRAFGLRGWISRSAIHKSSARSEVHDAANSGDVGVTTHLRPCLMAVESVTSWSDFPRFSVLRASSRQADGPSPWAPPMRNRIQRSAAFRRHSCSRGSSSQGARTLRTDRTAPPQSGFPYRYRETPSAST